MIYGKTEEIDEIEINVKGVIPINEAKAVSRAVELAGVDISINAHNGGTRIVKAIVMPYKARGRNRNVPELPEYYSDLGEYNDEYYYLILAADDLRREDRFVNIKGSGFIIANRGNRFLHDDVLYNWCIVQRLTDAVRNHYDDLDSNSPCRAGSADHYDTLLHPFELP